MNLSRQFKLKRMADIRKYCSRVVKIDHGRIVADGPTEEVLGA